VDRESGVPIAAILQAADQGQTTTILRKHPLKQPDATERGKADKRKGMPTLRRDNGKRWLKEGGETIETLFATSQREPVQWDETCFPEAAGMLQIGICCTLACFQRG
jgi:hypothetical protein